MMVVSFQTIDSSYLAFDCVYLLAVLHCIRSVTSRTSTTGNLNKLFTHLSFSTAPTSTVDAFTEQLMSVVTRELDLVAPVQTCNKHRPKASSKWLSPEAIRAKRLRLRLERRWKTSDLDMDRITYRVACRMAQQSHKLISAFSA